MPIRPSAFIVALLAIAVPLLLCVPAVPDAVFCNQLAAVAGWGLWMMRMDDCRSRIGGRRWGALLGLVALCVVIALRADAAGPLVLATLLAAVAALVSGLQSRSCEPIAMAWAVAGGCSVAVAAVQYFAPGWTDGLPVAANSSPGRAIGNMRQPNHLATALLCAMVWTAWLWQAGRLRSSWAAVLLLSMVVGVAMSASRTGAISLGVLTAWALLDRRLPRVARWTLGLTPLAWALAWLLLAIYASLEHAQFYGTERLQAGGDISSSRFAIWRDALVLIGQDPWAGVGWGKFNFAWTFTPLPDRPVAFFDHAHNLPLQLAVEIGVPAMLGVLGLLFWALWRARGGWQRAGAEPGHPARAALVMLAVLAVHSLLEYPLWYAYFLLPAAWTLGLFLGAAGEPGADRAAPRGCFAAWRTVGILMLLGAAYAGWDHRRIEAIFAPGPSAAPLTQRIAKGRTSLLFGHHADYAAVTTEPRDQRLESFRRPLHQLVDVRLLTAYIEALQANGRMAEAMYATQRLREFRRDDAQAYFKGCEPDSDASPLQCDRRPMPLRWRDLEP